MISHLVNKMWQKQMCPHHLGTVHSTISSGGRWANCHLIPIAFFDFTDKIFYIFIYLYFIGGSISGGWEFSLKLDWYLSSVCSHMCVDVVSLTKCCKCHCSFRTFVLDKQDHLQYVEHVSLHVEKRISTSRTHRCNVWNWYLQKP